MEFKKQIYYCADDYGISVPCCEHIEECVKDGIINKISVLPNSGVKGIEERIKTMSGVLFCIHLNLVEGTCVSDKDKLFLLTDNNGYFKNTFAGLFKLSLLNQKNEFKNQIKTEIKAQILKALDFLPKNAPICLDSHQHTHMIPLIFTAVSEVIKEEKLNVEYLRIPSEPILPFLKVPGFYLQYFSLNFVKQFTLKFFKFCNRKKIKDLNVSTACFFGIMFSGNMNEKRVKKLLPHYKKYAEKHNLNIEVLFHPGYMEKREAAEKNEYFKEIKFKKFYLSSGRLNEYNACKNLNKKQKNKRYNKI